jgi:hypothetical protein
MAWTRSDGWAWVVPSGQHLGGTMERAARRRSCDPVSLALGLVTGPSYHELRWRVPSGGRRAWWKGARTPPSPAPGCLCLIVVVPSRRNSPLHRHGSRHDRDGQLRLEVFDDCPGGAPVELLWPCRPSIGPRAGHLRTLHCRPGEGRSPENRS